MGTIIRRNERSWAIVIISEIKVMLNGLGLKIKSAGGELPFYLIQNPNSL